MKEMFTCMVCNEAHSTEDKALESELERKILTAEGKLANILGRPVRFFDVIGLSK